MKREKREKKGAVGPSRMQYHHYKPPSPPATAGAGLDFGNAAAAAAGAGGGTTYGIPPPSPHDSPAFHHGYLPAPTLALPPTTTSHSSTTHSDFMVQALLQPPRRHSVAGCCAPPPPKDCYYCTSPEASPDKRRRCSLEDHLGTPNSGSVDVQPPPLFRLPPSYPSTTYHPPPPPPTTYAPAPPAPTTYAAPLPFYTPQQRLFLPPYFPPAPPAPQTASQPSTKPFLCSFTNCNARFSRNHDLKRHELIHTGERKWKCRECGRAFGRRDALARHLTASPGGGCKALYGRKAMWLRNKLKLQQEKEKKRAGL